MSDTMNKSDSRQSARRKVKAHASPEIQKANRAKRVAARLAKRMAKIARRIASGKPERGAARKLRRAGA
jgi:hypothetical protein